MANRFFQKSECFVEEHDFGVRTLVLGASKHPSGGPDCAAQHDAPDILTDTSPAFRPLFAHGLRHRRRTVPLIDASVTRLCPHGLESLSGMGETPRLQAKPSGGLRYDGRPCVNCVEPA